MTCLLWAASALAKVYVPEAGSPTAAALYAGSAERRSVTTFVGYAEAISVLLRKRHRGEISQQALAHGISALRNDVLESPNFDIATVSETDFARATVHVLRHHLNASDAVVLLVFLRYARAMAVDGATSILVASDHRLLRAARQEGLGTLDPETVAPHNIASLLSP